MYLDAVALPSSHSLPSFSGSQVRPGRLNQSACVPCGWEMVNLIAMLRNMSAHEWGSIMLAFGFPSGRQSPWEIFHYEWLWIWHFMLFNCLRKANDCVSCSYFGPRCMNHIYKWGYSLISPCCQKQTLGSSPCRWLSFTHSLGLWWDLNGNPFPQPTCCWSLYKIKQIPACITLIIYRHRNSYTYLSNCNWRKKASAQACLQLQFNESFIWSN